MTSRDLLMTGGTYDNKSTVWPLPTWLTRAVQRRIWIIWNGIDDWCTWWSRGSWICQMGIETQHSQKYNGLRRQFLRCITGFRLIHILALNFKRFHQLFIQPWTRPDGHTENSTTSLPDRRCDWSRRCWLIGGEGHSCLITSEDWIGMP